MNEYASDTDSEYTNYWRDWVSEAFCLKLVEALGSCIYVGRPLRLGSCSQLGDVALASRTKTFYSRQP